MNEEQNKTTELKDEELDQAAGGAINVFDTDEPTFLCPNCGWSVRRSAQFCSRCYLVFK